MRSKPRPNAPRAEPDIHGVWRKRSGKATRWLCAHGIDGTKSLAQLLEQGLAASLKNHRPVEMQSAWAGQGVLCPIITGALLSDRSDLLHAGPIRIQNLAVPVYLLPFVASAARAQVSVISLTSDLFSAATDGGHLEAGQEWPALSDHVQIALGGQLYHPSTASDPRNPGPGLVGTPLTDLPTAPMRPPPKNPGCWVPVRAFPTMTE